jgi:hypothetical protein
MVAGTEAMAEPEPRSQESNIPVSSATFQQNALGSAQPHAGTVPVGRCSLRLRVCGVGQRWNNRAEARSGVPSSARTDGHVVAWMRLLLHGDESRSGSVSVQRVPARVVVSGTTRPVVTRRHAAVSVR